MKKKGLIISTVVMVVVLIASLTTATYAWFSAQASATVDDLAFTTKAADGLQIAMKNAGSTTAEYVSGNLTYNSAATDNNYWEGDVNDWGTNLGFDAIDIGEITDAVTYHTTQNYPVFSGYIPVAALEVNTTYYIPTKYENITTKEGFDAISGAKYYEKESKYVLANKLIDSVTTYYTVKSTKTGKTAAELPNSYTPNSWWVRATSTATITPEGIMNNGQFLVPTGYDDSINPIGYASAVRNGNYYYLTMAVKPVTDVDKLGLKMTFGATQKKAAQTLDTSVTQGNLNGAMAAATRCNILFENSALQTNNKSTQNIAPFSAFYVDGTSLKKYTGENDPSFKSNEDGEYNATGVYEYVLSDASVKAGTIYYITMEIWIEGTDAECIQETAGGGITLKMEFVYDKNGNTPVDDFAAGTTVIWA